jgi:hypothetical protein
VGAELAEQSKKVAENPAFGHAAVGNTEEGCAGILNGFLCGSDTKDFAMMCAAIGQARDYVLLLGDETFDVVMEVRKGTLHLAHVVAEGFAADGFRAQGAAKDDGFGQKLVGGREVPGIPHFVVVTLNQVFVLDDGHRSSGVRCNAKRK